MSFDVTKINTARKTERELDTQIRSQVKQYGTCDLGQAMDYFSTWGSRVFILLGGGKDGSRMVPSVAPGIFFKFRANYHDRLGKPVKPGDTVQFNMGHKEYGYNHVGDLVKLSSKELNRMLTLWKARKDPKDCPYNIEEYTADEDCCIRVPFDIATHLLRQHTWRNKLPETEVSYKTDRFGMETDQVASEHYYHTVTYISPTEELKRAPKAGRPKNENN